MTIPKHDAMSPELLSRFAAYYRNDPSWGSLHIVLDDGNVEDHHVAWCRNYALEQGDSEGVALADEIAKMSKTQRRKLEARVDAFTESPDANP